MRGNLIIEPRDAKAALRARLLAARAELSGEAARGAAEAAQDAMAAWLAARGVRRVALYAAIAGEVPTARLHAALSSAGVGLAYPLVAPGRPTLSFHAVADPAALVPAGRYRIPSPVVAAHPEVPLAALDVVVVPGIAYDRRGMRLGFGAGYYDRTVAGLAPGRLAGLGYDMQVVDAIAREPHDLTLGAVVTESGVLLTEPAR